MGTTPKSATAEKMFSRMVSDVEMQTLPRPSPVKGRAPHPPPPPCNRNVHTFRHHTSQHHEICTSVIMQPKNFYPTKGHTTRVLKRVSRHQRNIDSQIVEPQPGDSEGTHEAPMTRYQKHPSYAKSTRIQGTPTYPTNKCAHHTDRPRNARIPRTSVC